MAYSKEFLLTRLASPTANQHFLSFQFNVLTDLLGFLISLSRKYFDCLLSHFFPPVESMNATYTCTEDDCGDDDQHDDYTVSLQQTSYQLTLTQLTLASFTILKLIIIGYSYLKPYLCVLF